MATRVVTQHTAAENKPGHRQFKDYRLPAWVKHPLKPEPRKAAIIFPGDRNVQAPFSTDVLAMDEVKELLKSASSILATDVEAALMSDGKPGVDTPMAAGYDDALTFVANAVAYAKFKDLYPEVDERPQAVGGIAVGEYNALHAAGVITFEQGLMLVKQRCKELQEEAKDIRMQAALLAGFDQSKVEKLRVQAEKLDAQEGVSDPTVSIAQHLWEHGFLCKGKKSSMKKLEEVAGQDRDGGTVQLMKGECNVSNTPLAKPATDKVAGLMEELIPVMKPPRCEVYFNSLGCKAPPQTNPESLLDVLKGNVAEPVLWELCIDQMMRFGVVRFFECGRGSNLRQSLEHIEYQREAPYQVFRAVTFLSVVAV